jgi:N-acetylglucosamine kinase-like BadF-type ATPase
MEYILGVDGGGTKTDYLLLDMTGKIINTYRGGPTNHEVYKNGFSGALKELEKGVKALLLPLNIRASDVTMAVFGMSGIDVLFQKEIMKNLIFSLGFKNIKVINDAFLGIKAGSPDGIGICLVNGTGNTVAGIDKNGKHLQVGGTGYFFGDEGGGFHMAGMTIRAVHEELFRCGKKTMITPRLLSILGVSDDKYFVDRVYDVFFSRILDPKEILRIMFNCANNGDEVAIEIVNRTSKEMAKSVCGCMRRLNFGYKVDIVLVGSINLKAETPLLLERLAFEISKLTDQKCNFIKLLVPPVYGAILWAHELAYGHPLSNKAKENILNQLKLG